MPLFTMLIAGAVGASTPHSEPRRCLLVVDGKTLVQGRCMVFPMGDGGFTLNTATKGRRVGHFAVVDVTGRDRGDASWNARAGDLHAQDPLGPVVRSGTCWSNARARICAWK
jgi:hypothetical protein